MIGDDGDCCPSAELIALELAHGVAPNVEFGVRRARSEVEWRVPERHVVRVDSLPERLLHYRRR